MYNKSIFQTKLFEFRSNEIWEIGFLKSRIVLKFASILVRGEMVENQLNRALCDTILTFDMVSGYGMGITKTTGYKLACPSGGQ